ncbi:MAG: hypothetical protein KF744_08990 [Taibaiella sp.]|nr:hypothetical protein [Taibaiella sp.]
MKRLIFLLMMVLICGGAMAQTDSVTLAYGSSGYVTVNGQNYKRGDLMSHYVYNTTGDSTLAILYTYGRLPLISPRKNSLYIYADSSRKSARSMVVLRTWMNTNFEYIGN